MGFAPEGLWVMGYHGLWVMGSIFPPTESVDQKKYGLRGVMGYTPYGL
jgi:hypothetical protein